MATPANICTHGFIPPSHQKQSKFVNLTPLLFSADTDEEQCKISHTTSRKTRIMSLPNDIVNRWGGSIKTQNTSPFQFPRETAQKPEHLRTRESCSTATSTPSWHWSGGLSPVVRNDCVSEDQRPPTSLAKTTSLAHGMLALSVGGPGNKAALSSPTHRTWSAVPSQG